MRRIVTRVLNSERYCISYEREGISSDHSQAAKNMCLVNAIDEETVSRRASQIAGAEKGQAELNDRRLSGRSETAVTQSCFKLLMN